MRVHVYDLAYLHLLVFGETRAEMRWVRTCGQPGCCNPAYMRDEPRGEALGKGSKPSRALPPTAVGTAIPIIR